MWCPYHATMTIDWGGGAEQQKERKHAAAGTGQEEEGGRRGSLKSFKSLLTWGMFCLVTKHQLARMYLGPDFNSTFEGCKWYFQVWKTQWKCWFNLPCLPRYTCRGLLHRNWAIGSNINKAFPSHCYQKIQFCRNKMTHFINFKIISLFVKGFTFLMNK